MKETDTILRSKKWNKSIVNNEELAARAFSAQAVLFDELYSGDTIIKYKRKRVRDHVTHLLTLESHMLELNSGTGEDAIFFASQGYRVHATDISSIMLSELNRKVESMRLDKLISSEQCSFTALENLQKRGPYDMVFSNFAGLNCTEYLDKVLLQLPGLVKPEGLVTLVVLPKFCLWETLLFIKGKWRTAFRRFFSRKGTTSHVEGVYFNCWYYNSSYISLHLHETFDVIALEGLCTLVPPSYISNFAQKYPKTYAWLIEKENRLKSNWPWKLIGDYYIITLRKK